jgi:hypothetical protein
MNIMKTSYIALVCLSLVVTGFLITHSVAYFWSRSVHPVAPFGYLDALEDKSCGGCELRSLQRMPTSKDQEGADACPNVGWLGAASIRSERIPSNSVSCMISFRNVHKHAY